MSFFLRSKNLDIATGGSPIALLNEDEAKSYGIMAGDMVTLIWSKNKSATVTADVAKKNVKQGEVGLFREVWEKRDIEQDDIVEVLLESRPLSVRAIQKKMLGQPINQKEASSIIQDIVDGKLNSSQITYFTASSFVKAYSDDELYYLTKAMAQTGEMINLKQKAVDKHSVGGLAGNRVTMITVPIIASLGLIIPKSSSRAITSPAGTADTMEVLAPVTFTMKQIRNMVKKTNACIVWGGGVKMAPADDLIIKVSHPLGIEPYDKIIISIMAKKVAMGIDYLIIDMPYGLSTKIPNRQVALKLSQKFVSLGQKFGMAVKVIPRFAKQPIGQGIGPGLEARDVLRVLQQHDLRPRDLENKAIQMAGELLELKKFCAKGQGSKIAKQTLVSGKAWEKMNEIIIAQGGKANQDSEEIIKDYVRYEIHADKSGIIQSINNKAIKEICVNLGAPKAKNAGIHIHARHSQKVKKGDKLYTMYAENNDRLKLGIAASSKIKIFSIVGNQKKLR